MTSARRPGRGWWTATGRAPLAALLLALLAALVTGARPGPAIAAVEAGADGLLCREGIARAERAESLPAGLLQAIALAESGRWDAARRAALPWPWTVNAGGEAARFASKEEAVRHVERLRAQGRSNIDVGCLQINLGWHPAAFTDLAAAFDPDTNAAYGAAFLATLREEAGSWEAAVERYHSRDPDRGQSYRERVWRFWAGRSDGPPAGGEPLLLATTAAPAGTASPGPGRPAAAGPRAAPLATVPIRSAAIERAALQSVNRQAARQTWRWLQVQAPMPTDLPAGPPLAVVAALDPRAAEPAPGAVLPAAALRRPIVFAGPTRGPASATARVAIVPGLRPPITTPVSRTLPTAGPMPGPRRTASAS